MGKFDRDMEIITTSASLKSLMVTLFSASSPRTLHVFGLLLWKMEAVIKAFSWAFLP